ncbi:hypothetical protein [Psychroserpens luteus]|uniref:Uncharacterized protein n=1 Tax=Psychroserpens luteus TaxID=1434066 RepID=A0ABW5ZTW2_9FLAO|nr:hypothetical protein [Psychroserpens luteus]
MKKIIVLLFVCFSISCFAQIPIEEYKTEISKLNSQEDYDKYWEKLLDLDQITHLEETETQIESDSISLSNMIRTALIFETHGNGNYNPDNLVPILHLTHNYNAQANLAFWPIIMQVRAVGGVIETFGGKFPAYQLEGLSMSFYNYSLLYQEDKYPDLLYHLDTGNYKIVSKKLLEIFKTEKSHQKLKVIESIGKWTNKPFKDMEEYGFFEFVKMSDNNLYIKRLSRLQKLILLSSEKGTKTYKIEHEPFGWTYKLTNNKLSLVDDLNNILITYNTHK